MYFSYGIWITYYSIGFYCRFLTSSVRVRIGFLGGALSGLMLSLIRTLFAKLRSSSGLGLLFPIFLHIAYMAHRGSIFSSSMFWFEMFTVITLERLGVSADSFYKGLGK